MNHKRPWIRTLILCWLAYAAIYAGRVNLAVALPGIGSSLHLDKASCGLIGSVFFWVYGAGQLINGQLGDRVSVRHYIFTGLFFTAAANFAFSMTQSFPLMLLIWGINGIAQSMLWGPMIRLIGDWTEPSARTRAVTAVSTSAVGGYLLAWGMSGQLMTHTSVAWVFRVPAVLIAVVAVFWFLGIRNHPSETHISTHISQELRATVPAVSLKYLLLRTGLPVLILACIAQGIVKDGITLWAPTFFMEAHGLDIAHATFFILLIPLANLGGILFSGWLNRLLGQRETLTAAFLLTGGLLSLTGLYFAGSLGPAVAAVFLSLTSAMMNGANNMLLGMVPLSFSPLGRVSSVAGMLDFSAYLASGSAAFLSGLMAENLGWNGMFACWIVILLVAVSVLALFSRRKNTRPAVSEISASPVCEEVLS